MVLQFGCATDSWEVLIFSVKVKRQWHPLVTEIWCGSCWSPIRPDGCIGPHHKV